MAERFRIAIAGLGTVGAGTVELLAAQRDLLTPRSGRSLELVAVSARDRSKDRGLSLPGIVWYEDAVEMAREAEIDLLVESIGGSEGVALETVRAALSRGCHVVTANKALVAHHGAALARLAAEKGACLAYEAAVAGGIPIIKVLREGLSANRLTRVYGILNGTSNFIMSSMRKTGRAFSDVLAEAQALGYAEADPSFDVDGIDAAHKLAILAALCFGCEVDFEGVYIEGVRDISAFDVEAAEELGYRIKLLGIAASENGRVRQRVHPCMLPMDTPIATVEGVLNAVVAEGDYIGSVMQQGPGAGAKATASAVVADIVDIARGNRVPTFTVPVSTLRKAARASMDSHLGSYYLRIPVRDEPGVIADISAILRDHNISMEAMLQHGRADTVGKPVQVVITTHTTSESAMREALKQIGACERVLSEPSLIRIERF